MTKNFSIKNLKLFSKKASLDARKARAGYLFVLPFVFGILAIYLPILLDSVWFSFNSLSFGAGDSVNLEYVGFEYYAKAFQTADFTTKLLSSLQTLLFQVPAILIFSLFIAVVLNQDMLGRALFRAIYFVPVIIATGLMDTINAADIATDMADSATSGSTSGTGQEGSTGAGDLFNAMDLAVILQYLPVGNSLVQYVVDLVNSVFNIINYSGVQMLIFLAGLQSISPAIYEACQIEGATAWETFWKVTFPMISPMILVNAFYTVIDSFTRESSAVMSYINGYTGTGYQSMQTAMSWIYFLIVFLVIAIVGGILSAFVFYQRRD